MELSTRCSQRGKLDSLRSSVMSPPSRFPYLREGLDACYRLSKELVKTNVTLVFCALPAILLTQEPTYVSPFKLVVSMTSLGCRSGGGSFHHHWTLSDPWH